MERKICVLVFFLLALGCQTASRTRDRVKSGFSQKNEVQVTEIRKDSIFENSASSLSHAGLPSQKELHEKLPQNLNTQLGYILLDPETRAPLSEWNSDQLFIPSSVNKILTSVAALQILGSGYQFKTSIFISGKIKKGILWGDLILKGGGDPFFTLRDLMDLVLTLKKKGIREIKGRFLYDDRLFISQDQIDPDRDPLAPYNVGISALSSEFNLATLRWGVSPEGQVLTYSVLPDVPGMGVGLASEAESAGESNPFFPSLQNPDHWSFRRSLPPVGIKRIPVRKSSLFTAEIFRLFAKMNQIQLPEAEPEKSNLKPKLIASHLSLPLLDLVEKNLEFSNNLMSELFLLTSARHLTRKAKDLKASAETIQTWIKKKFSEVYWEGFVFNNGSGLGSGHRISPSQLASVLAQEDHLLPLLPIGGSKGTLSGRMTNPDLAFRVWAKTGSQAFSNGLAGYLFTQSGRKLVFAVLMTDFENRRNFDLQGEKTSPELKMASWRWAQKAREAQENLIQDWIRRF